MSSSPRRGFGWLTAITVVLLVAFGITDAEAHLTKYQYGETFSAFCWWLEKKVPATRLLFAAATLTLFTHLVFQVP